MSLFGISYPKFIGNIATTQDEVLLEHSSILEDKPVPYQYSSTSIKTGKKVFKNAGRHWTYKVKVFIYKYADPLAKYQELKSYENSSVWLYRHSDGDTFYNSTLDKIEFFLVSVNELYLSFETKKDCLTLTFLSKDFIDGDYDFAGYITRFVDFTGNTYNTSEWIRGGFTVEDETVTPNAGVCVAGCNTSEINTYNQNRFVSSLISSNDSHIMITCDAWGGNGYGAYPMLMCRANSNYLFGLTFLGTSNAKVITMKASIGYPTWSVDTQTTVPTSQWNSYKIIYNRITNCIYFFVKLNKIGNWIPINEDPIILTGMDSQKFMIGIGGIGAFYSSGLPPAFDNITVFYKPDGA
jgi:hypothetical protein